MKNTKRVFSVLGALAVALSLASCGSKQNSKTPVGNLDLSSTYASLGTGESVSVKDMYNLFRNTGYQSVITELKRQLFQKEMESVTYQNHKKEFDKYLLNTIFGKSSEDDFIKLKESEKEKLVLQFIDNRFKSTGIDYTKAYKDHKENFIPTVLDDNTLSYNWEQSLLDDYKFTLATMDYARKYLNSISNKENVKDSNGDDVTNNYYIDQDKIKSYYSSIKDYTSTADFLGVKYDGQEGDYKNHAIVIKFANKEQALKYIELANAEYGKSIQDITSNEEAIEYYCTLYNLYYKVKNEDKVTISNYLTNKNTSFVITKDEDTYSNLDSNIRKFMKDSLTDITEEGKSYLTEPYDVSGDAYYYMAFRINVYEGKDYTKLNKDVRESNDFMNKIKELLIDTWVSESYANGLVESRLAEDGLSLNIYDPVYEAQYMSNYSDYSYTKKFNNDLVFEFTYKYQEDAIENANQEIQGQYSVENSYAKLNSIYGVSKATELLAVKYLNNCSVIANELDSDTKDGYNDAIKDTVKKFNKGKTDYSKKMGLENYLVLTYGYDNKDDIVNYKYLGSDLISQYKKYFGDFKGEKIVDKAANIQIGNDIYGFKDNGLFANLKHFTDKNYDNFYNLSIAHMLISVDMDNDGTNDDPKEFISSLDSQTLELFKAQILELADAIVKEAKIITTDKKITALQYIAKVFNNNGYEYVLQNEDYKGRTWASFKTKFDFSLRAEDLNTIDNSNGSNYVEEFTNAVIDLNKRLEADDYKDIVKDIKNNGFWVYEDTVANTNGVTINGDLSQLTATVYGWHMLYVYGKDEQKTCKLNRDSDTNLSTDVKDSEGRTLYVLENGELTTEKEIDGKSLNKLKSIGSWEYQDIVVYKHDQTTTEDDEVLYVSGYSEDKYASLEQLFIYFMETQNNGSVSSLRSSTLTAVTNVFSNVYERYVNSEFSNYRLYKQIGEVTFTDNTLNDKKAIFFESIKRSIDSYKVLTSDDLFFGWFDYNWTISNLHN